MNAVIRLRSLDDNRTFTKLDGVRERVQASGLGLRALTPGHSMYNVIPTNKSTSQLSYHSI